MRSTCSIPGRQGAARTLVLCALLAVAPGCQDGPSERIAIRIGGHAMTVKVARTSKARADGYFNCEAPKDGEGILFLLPGVGTHWFTMSDGHRSVPFELGIAFADADGRITQVQRLAPDDATRRRSPPDTLYAVEGSWAYFQKAPIERGMVIEGLPEDAPPR